MRLGPYEVRTPLGKGGMGEVYRARDTRLGRDVAVKVLPEELSRDPLALSRFESEARAVAAISHPNILAIHDVGEERGIRYVVTELLEGETLRAAMVRGQLPVRTALDIAEQVARGLVAAHGRGIVHRDIKPENLFLTGDGHVKILDFGLARAGAPYDSAFQTADENAPTLPNQSQSGAIVGTLAYMSPEQARGQAVDTRSDQFSFGIVLYEMLTGERPFKGATATDVLAAIVRDEPEALSRKAPETPEPLRWIVERCLAKDPKDRYDSTRDLARDLAAWREHSSDPLVAPASLPRRTPSLSPRVRRMVGAGLALAVALVAAGAAGWFWKGRAAGPAALHLTRVAVLPFENLGSAEDDYFADGMADEVRGKLASLPGFQVIARASSTPYKKTTKTPQQIAQELETTYLLTATVRWQKNGGTSRVHVSPELVEVGKSGPAGTKWQQPFDAALTDVFQVQSEIAGKVAEALGSTLGAVQTKRLAERPTQNLAAYDAFLRGEETCKGMTLFDYPTLTTALGFYEKAVAIDPSFAKAWARIARISSMKYGENSPTRALADRAKEAAEKVAELAPDSAEGFAALANYQSMVLVDYRKALELFSEARRRAPNDGEILGLTALAERNFGHFDEAVEHYYEAERLDPRSITVKLGLAQALAYLRRYPDAREAFDRAYAVEPSNLGSVQWRAMSIILETGDVAAARARLREDAKGVEPTNLVAYFATFWDFIWALDEEQTDLLLRLTPGAFGDDRAVWGIALAEVYHRRGDGAKTRLLAEEARKAYEEQLRETPNADTLHTGLGMALAYLGQKAEAVREGERAVELTPATKDPFVAPMVRHSFVRICVLAGEYEKALGSLEALMNAPYYLTPAYLRVDPNFDPVRKNPRFQKLVAEKR